MHDCNMLHCRHNSGTYRNPRPQSKSPLSDDMTEIELLPKPQCKPEQIIHFSSFDDVEDDDELDLEDVSLLPVQLPLAAPVSTTPCHTSVPCYASDSPSCNSFSTLTSLCTTWLLRLIARSGQLERPSEGAPILIVDGAADVGLLGKGWQVLYHTGEEVHLRSTKAGMDGGCLPVVTACTR